MAVKKPVAKKVVKKAPVKRKPKTTQVKSPPPVCWFKLVTGEEIVAYVDLESFPGQLIAIHPSVMLYYNDQLIFTPYGLQAKDREVFTFPEDVVVNTYEVSDEFATLYILSRRATGQLASDMFDLVLAQAITKYQKKLVESHNTPEPTDEELSNIEKEVDSFTVETVTSLDQIPRSKADIIDSLVELAEKSGKGKNV